MRPDNVAAQWDAPANYYNNATGSGQILKNQLTSAMSSGHIQRSYGNFRFSTAITDRDPNNSSRILLAYNRASVPGNWDSGATWNREHVWPQVFQPGSASNSSQGNLGDPHALRPANPVINSDRGSKPFGFESTVGAFRSLGQYWFPGDTDKGDIARSLFYSDTRWTSLGLSLTDNFPVGSQMGDLTSIVAWHYLDPPDDFDRRRNHVIYSSSFNPQYFTNNRNAYIDRPEFVWSVYVNQQNDSRLTISGGTINDDGSSVRTIDFGTVIVGTVVSTEQQLTLDKDGLDGTYYSVQASGDAVSDVSGFYNAFRTDGTDSRTLNVNLDFEPALPGIKSGLIIIDNLDVTTAGGVGHGANDGDDLIVLVHTILDHSNASFSGSNDVGTLSLDLGEFEFGATIPPSTFEIHNLESLFVDDLTARLDLTSIIPIPADSDLQINGPLFENLDAGEHIEMTVSGIADELGDFSTDFVFLLSDEALPGATAQALTLSVSYSVVQSTVTLGDVNLDGVVNLLDVAPFVDLLSSGGFQNEADINQDGFFDLLDVAPFVDILAQ